MKFRVIDLETTGLDPQKDKPVEFAFIDATYGQQFLFIQNHRDGLLNPGMPISASASGVHHITNSMVDNKPTFDEVKPKIMRPTQGRVFVAHNAAFEKAFIGVEPWICTMILARRLWPEADDHKLQTLRYHLNLKRLGDSGNKPINTIYNGPIHRALPDAAWTLSLLAAILEKAPCSQYSFIDWATKPQWTACIPFGKHKGKAWSAVHPQYLHWLRRDPSPKDMDTLYNMNLALARKHASANPNKKGR